MGHKGAQSVIGDGIEVEVKPDVGQSSVMAGTGDGEAAERSSSTAEEEREWLVVSVWSSSCRCEIAAVRRPGHKTGTAQRQ